MKPQLVYGRALLTSVLIAATLLSACDDDPNEPDTEFPDFSLEDVPDTLGTQQAIRVVFSDSLSAATALDPANFVVTNLCNGLRIPGAVRLGGGPGGDTLIFTPSQPLPFLTQIGVRIQNLLTPAGVPQRTPIVFQRITAPPPIRDQTWSFLDSPTNDALRGVSFVDDVTGFIVEAGGTVYRTTDGGRSFIARFKDINLSATADLRAFGPDTVFMVGSRRVGGTTVRALFRSINGGQSFETAVQATEFLYVNSMRRVGGAPHGVFGGLLTTSGLYRYFGTTNTATGATGFHGSGWVLTGADLSPDGNLAVASFNGSTDPQLGAASRSMDGGLTYSSLTLPANVYGLVGAGFVNNTIAILMGDSSVVLRFDASAPTPTFAALGAPQGIPQTERNPTTGEVTTYRFTDVRFAPGSSVGWMTGSLTRTRAGQPSINAGVILMSEDAGLTWRRQAISGALDDGLAFSPVVDLQALREDFAALVGLSGLIASRTETTRSGLTACSFITTP